MRWCVPTSAIRYADILLMYAECLNELTQGQAYQQKDWKGNDIVITGRDISEMKRGIRPVRIRAGLPDYTDGIYNSQDDLRAKIKRERMIEFMGEGKRYFDLRRWMDAPVEENKRVYGLNVFQTAQNRDEFMQVIPVYNLSATFTDKMYFWPYVGIFLHWLYFTGSSCQRRQNHYRYRPERR